MVEGLKHAASSVGLIRKFLFFMCNFQSAVCAEQFLGDHGEEVTPVPIPNTAVKLLSDGSSWSAGTREISASPS